VTIQQAQARQATSLVNLFESTYPVYGGYWGGDFNIDYPAILSGTISPNPYTTRREANTGFPTLDTHDFQGSTDQKLDYSFGRSSLYTLNLVDVKDRSDFSDHGLVYGYFYSP
jgi:hypothetical protein